MLKLSKISFSIFFFILLTLNSYAEKLLPYSGEVCRIAPTNEINEFVNSLNVNILGYGDLNDQERIIVTMDKSHDRLYAFKTYGEKNNTVLCLMFGGREIDLMAAEVSEVIKKKWGMRKSRYHIPLSMRAFEGPIPHIPNNMNVDDAILILTSYVAMPEFNNTYDEVINLKIVEKTKGMSRGKIMEIANKQLSRSDTGEIELNNETRSGYQEIIELMDHGMHPMILLVDKKDNDFIFIAIDRKRKKVNTLTSGKNFVLKE